MCAAQGRDAVARRVEARLTFLRVFEELLLFELPVPCCSVCQGEVKR